MTPDERAARLASEQLGLITWPQGVLAGLTPSMIKTRLATHRWSLVYPGVYRFAGTEATWRQSVLAACLSAGPTAVASHLTAGVLWGIVERRRPPVHVTVAYPAAPRSFDFTVHRSRIPFERVVTRGPVPLAPAGRTLIDLAAVIGRDELEESLDVALHRRYIDAVEFAIELDALGSAGLHGLATLRELVAQRVGRARHPETKFETKILRILERYGVPTPELQYEVRRDGHLLGRVDLVYPDEKVFIEAEGWEFHSSRQAFDRGYIRRNLIVEMGFVPLGFTTSDLRRPRYVADTVRRVLAMRRAPGVVSL